jgi:hypothetical protein
MQLASQPDVLPPYDEALLTREMHVVSGLVFG